MLGLAAALIQNANAGSAVAWDGRGHLFSVQVTLLSRLLQRPHPKPILNQLNILRVRLDQSCLPSQLQSHFGSGAGTTEWVQHCITDPTTGLNTGTRQFFWKSRSVPIALCCSRYCPDASLVAEFAKLLHAALRVFLSLLSWPDNCIVVTRHRILVASSLPGTTPEVL